MPAGFQVFNDHNTVQVDQDYRNLCFITKATAATTTAVSTPSGTTSYLDLTITNVTSPVLAWSSAVAGLVLYVTSSGTSRTYRMFFNGPVGTNFTYYIFDVPPASSSTFGLQVFNASNQLVFDAQYRYMRIRDFRQAVGTTTHTYSAGSYAVVQARSGFSITTTGGFGSPWVDQMRGIGARTITNGVAFQAFTVGLFSSSGVYTGPSYAPDFLILDVTGY